MKYTLNILLLFTVFWSFGQDNCSSNAFVNGGFEGNQGEAIVASGWAGTSTPDCNDAFSPLMTTPGYIWSGTPISSPSGGIWQNLYDSETVTQTVTLIPNINYNFCFEYTAQSIEVPSFELINFPAAVNVIINGSLVYTTPIDSIMFDWSSVCFGYTPTKSSNVVEFMPANVGYIAIDGVCLSPELSIPDKTLIRIVDALGRETVDKPNVLLFHIFSDGTIVKVFRVE